MQGGYDYAVYSPSTSSFAPVDLVGGLQQSFTLASLASQYSNTVVAGGASSREVRRQNPLLSDVEAVVDDVEADAKGQEDQMTEHAADTYPAPPFQLPENTIGLAICSITRDAHFISGHWQGIYAEPYRCRIFRTISAMLLLVLTLFTQILIVRLTKQYVVAPQVDAIRGAYGEYEKLIYGEQNCTETMNGECRGMPGTFPAFEVALQRLGEMSEEDRENICCIPMAHPVLAGVVLFFWTLQCLAELEKAITLQLSVMMLETTNSMSSALSVYDDEEEGVVVGMTLAFKVLLLLVTFIPRICINLYLLWIGCRWLLATTSMADLIMNALGLGFVQGIKDQIYMALAPARCKLDLEKTTLKAYPRELGVPGFRDFMTMVTTLTLGLLWVILYMLFFEQVLPDYKWDVADVCRRYIDEHLHYSL
jgi:hypothetical protein